MIRLTAADDPARVEAKLYAALRDGSELVELDGFPLAHLRTIADRLGATLSRTPNGRWSVSTSARGSGREYEGTAVLYNASPASDPGRSDAVLARELRAFVEAARPLVIGLNEAIRYRLPKIEGYRLVRDRSRDGRANVAAYVRDDLGKLRITWHDQRETWSRPRVGGRHAARSILEIEAVEAGAQFLVAHQPPKYTDNTVAAQAESIDTLERLIRGHAGPSVVMADFNRLRSEKGPGPGALARRVDGVARGQGIDGFVAQGMHAAEVTYRRVVAGLGLGTDHVRGAAFTRLRWRA